MLSMVLVSIIGVMNLDISQMSAKGGGQVNIADYENEDEVKIETKLEDSDFVKEHEESVQ